MSSPLKAKMGKVIYVSGKYRGESEREVFDNIIKARTAALKLWDEGWAVICPHTNSIFMGSQLGDDKFIEGDLEIVARCDAIFMLKGWQDSEGARLELARATEKRLVVYYEGFSEVGANDGR